MGDLPCQIRQGKYKIFYLIRRRVHKAYVFPHETGHIIGGITPLGRKYVEERGYLKGVDEENFVVDESNISRPRRAGILTL